MSTKAIILSRPDHFGAIVPFLRAPERAEVEINVAAAAQRFAIYCEYGYAETMIIDDMPAAVIGAVPQWAGLAEAWSLTTDLVYDNPIWFHKAVLKGLHTVRDKYKLRRIQASVRADNELAIDWHKRIGYAIETPEPMQKYGTDGAAYYLMARIF